VHLCETKRSKLLAPIAPQLLYILNVTRILIIRFSSIGDIVLTTPVIRALRQQLDGEVVIHYLTKTAFASIVESNPHVDHVWKFDEDLDGIIAELKDQAFDYVIDLHKNIRSSRVKHGLKTLTFSFDKLNFKKLLLTSFGIDRMPDVHIVDRYMASVQSFGIEDDGEGLDFFIPEKEELSLSELGPMLASGYVVWVVGAAHPGKRFSVEKSAAILKEVKQTVVLVGGADEVEDAAKIDSACGGNVVNLCGNLSIMGSASVISKAEAVVTPDTGMMHIAAAFKRRVISIWGCTSPKLGMYPYRPGKGSEILEPVGLDKRPCSKLGDSCKYPVNCIESIENSAVISALSLS